MQYKNPEIFIVVVIGVLLALLLVGFIVTIVFLYQHRRHQHLKELVQMKDLFEQEALRSQLEIQENIFRTIGLELHDNIGQLLSVVKMSLSILPIDKTHPAYESIQNSRQILNKAIVDVSHLTKSLNTERIIVVPFGDVLQYELDALAKSGIVAVDYQCSIPELPISEQKRIFLFRIFQEIINNMLKHSKASLVIVKLYLTEENKFALSIQDNGTGFDLKEKLQTREAAAGVGLKSLFNRAHLIGARLNIDSAPGQGTRVTIILNDPDAA